MLFVFGRDQRELAVVNGLDDAHLVYDDVSDLLSR